MKNPKWTKEEVIIALNLYMQFDYGYINRISQISEEVVEMSNLLKKMAIHSEVNKNDETFRSPSSVHMKLMNFLRLDERYEKNGLSNGSKLDIEVWKEYSSDPEKLQKKVKEIMLQYRKTNLQNTEESSLLEHTGRLMNYLEAALSEIKILQNRCNESRKQAVALDSIEESQRVITDMYRSIVKINQWETSISDILDAIGRISFSNSAHRGIDSKLLQSYNKIKIGRYVQMTFRELFRERKLSEEDIRNLSDPAWTRNNFHIGHPLLKEYDPTIDLKAQLKVNGYQRYWQEIYSYQGKEYLFCKEWFESNRKFFDKWLESFTRNISGLVRPDSSCRETGDKYTFLAPEVVRILNKKYKVKNWTNVLVQVCEIMIKNRPDIIKDLVNNQKFVGKTRKYFSYDGNDLTRAAKKLSNGLWVETNFSAQNIADLSRLVVLECGYSEQDIEYFIVPSKNPKREIQKEQKKKEIKFSDKYSSISLDEDTLRFIFRTIKDIDEQEICIETHNLSKKIAPRLEQRSKYKSPHHPLNNILKFLKDIGVIVIYQNAKRGKYVVEDYEMIQELISNPFVVQNFS